MQPIWKRLADLGFDTENSQELLDSMSKLQLFNLYRTYRIQWSRWFPTMYSENRSAWLKEKWSFHSPLKRPSEFPNRKTLQKEMADELSSLMNHYEFDSEITMIPDFVIDTFRLYCEQHGFTTQERKKII